MANRRKKTENYEELVKSGAKKYVRYEEGAQLLSMGIHAFTELAKEAGAVRRIKGVCIVNMEILNEYIEDMYS